MPAASSTYLAGTLGGWTCCLQRLLPSSAGASFDPAAFGTLAADYRARRLSNFAAAAVGILSVVPVQCAAKPAWGNLEWGMTKIEVKMAQPTAHDLDERGILGMPDTRLFGIDNYRIGTCSVEVAFSFNQGRLSAIAFIPDDSSSIIDNCAEVISGAVYAKFGQPWKHDRTHESTVTTTDVALWATPDMSVTLEITKISRDGTMRPLYDAYLTYQAPDASALGKL